MNQTVHRRLVLFVPGFDPSPVRRYRELYRREGARQADISGYDLTLSGRPGHPDRWTVQTRIQGARTETEFDVFDWSDVVRDAMPTGPVAAYAALARVAWAYLSSGAFWRLSRLRRGPVLVALYPVLALVLQAALALCVALWACFAMASLGISAMGAATLAATGAVAVFHLFAYCDRWTFTHYLMHDFAFAAHFRGRWPEGLDLRLSRHAGYLRAALARSDLDEVLVVGHSSGVDLAVSLVARALRDATPSDRRATLSFLSLGHALPMTLSLPGAAALRDDLAELAVAPDVTWVDVSAPGDPYCFALCDPVAAAGLSRAGGPLILSAAFSTSLGGDLPGWRILARHRQYLAAFRCAENYDYFAITAGPLALAARFEGRTASPQMRQRSVARNRGARVLP